MKITDEVFEFIKERYNGKKDLRKAVVEYEKLEAFQINENVFDKGMDIDNDVHQVMRLATQYYLSKAFDAMKIESEDPNVQELVEEGNIGTPGRIAKMWCGHNLKDDTEMMSGRWMQKPRMAGFPNTHQTKIPITKRVDLNSVCSHHAAIFSSFYREDAYAIVSYIPDKKVLGISKLQRVVDWVARRGWLQEELTQAIYDEVSKVAETDSVYVRLYNITHSCERNRGAQSNDGAFTTEYYGGDFNKKKIRDSIKG